MDKGTINAKGCGPLIAKKGYKDFSNNEDCNPKGNKDINTKEDKDINTEEDKDINTEEDKDIDTKADKDISTKEDKDINTEENKDCNTILYKLIAGSKADSNIGSNEFSILAKLKQDISLINARALTKVAKSNTASKYIASINKLADLVN
jgi:hypothetical protein